VDTWLIGGRSGRGHGVRILERGSPGAGDGSFVNAGTTPTQFGYSVAIGHVSTVVDESWLSAGSHSFDISRAASGLAPGVYFYRLVTAGGGASGRLHVVER
jgi:hypothetical protein